jgi:ribosome biogenesis GTPase / thiamine phosphate phosphatase
MNPDVLDRLRPIGCNSLVVQALSQIDHDGAPMRVTGVHRDSVTVHDGAVARRAQLLPRLAREISLAGEQMAVGDWVIAAVEPRDCVWLAARMPPINQISRRGPDGLRQCLVSNVDTALLVMGLDGDHNLRRLERYLAMAQSAGVWPVVVLTKQDLADTAADRIVDLHRRVPPGLPVHAVDARAPGAAEELRDYLGEGQTLVMLGSSGAGKSTLTNTLIGYCVQETGAVRAGDSRGRHTTSARSLHVLGTGACVIDTPGLRGLEVDTTEQGLQASFGDIATLSARCRFRDCTHIDEPDCAVRAGVHPDRLANYQKLRREIRRESMTFLDRRRQLAEWKARGRAADQRMRLKRG